MILKKRLLPILVAVLVMLAMMPLSMSYAEDGNGNGNENEPGGAAEDLVDSVTGYTYVPHDLSHEVEGSIHGIQYDSGKDWESVMACCTYADEGKSELCHYYYWPEIFLYADDMNVQYDGKPHGAHFAWRWNDDFAPDGTKMHTGFPDPVLVPGSVFENSGYEGETAAGDRYISDKAPTLPGEYMGGGQFMYLNMGNLHDPTADRDAVCRLNTPKYTIEPKVLSLNWSEDTVFPYDGQAHAPTVEIPADQIIAGDVVSVTRTEETTAGEHTAVAELSGKDSWKYTISGDTLQKDYVITSPYDVQFDPNVPKAASTKNQLAGNMDPQHFEYNETKELTKNAYDLPGYEFKGWNAQPDGSGTHYDNKASVSNLTKNGGTVTLYAEWDARKYTILFKESDDANARFHEQQAEFDTPGTLEAYNEDSWNWQTPMNSSLHGWQGKGFGSFYSDGAKYLNLCQKDGNGAPLLNEDGTIKGVTLIADWISNEKIVATITRDDVPQEGFKNCFTLVSINEDGSQGASFHIPPGSIQYSDGKYTFEPNSEQIPTGTYNLLFKGSQSTERQDGGLFADSSIGIEYEGDYAISTVFSYYTVSIEADPAYADHHGVEISGKRAKPISPSSPNTVVVPNGDPLDIKTTVDPGYHFDGYSVLGIAPAWDPGKAEQTITVEGKADIMAHIEANVYTVKFDANAKNGVSGTMEDQDMVYGEPQNLFANQYECATATFKEWNTEKDGSGTAYKDGQQVQDLTTENNGTVTLYAQWNLIKYPIKYNLKDGQLPDGKKNPTAYTVEDSFTLNNPVKKDYDFAGWLGTGLSNPEKKVTIQKGSSGKREYTAVWDIKQYTVNFATNGGTKVDEQTVKIHQKAKKPQDPTREGYIFVGWYADKQLTKKFDFNQEIVKDTTVYAKWKAIKPGPKPKPDPDKKVSAPLVAKVTAKGKKSLTYSWTKVEGAKGYDLFAARCNHKSKQVKCKKVKTIKGNKTFKWTRSGLKKKKSYKGYIKAWTIKDGKKKYIKTSPMMHAYTSGSLKTRTNAKSVKLKKTDVSLKAGKTFKIKAKVKKVKKYKRLMSKKHAPKLRYLSTNKNIATVSRSGKIKAKAPGSCKIYVYAHNGVSKTVKVTVY